LVAIRVDLLCACFAFLWFVVCLGVV